MTDTGQIPPPTPKTSSGKNTPEQGPIIKSEAIIIPTEIVIVKKLALQLEKIIREIKLEGEIIKIDTQNKEIHIKTPKGEIVVSLIIIENKETPKLYYGQAVTITIPAAAPPKTAKLQIIPTTKPPIENVDKTIKPEIPVSISVIKSLEIDDKITAIIINQPNKKPVEIIQTTKTIPPEIKINIISNVIKQPLEQLKSIEINNISIPKVASIFTKTTEIIQLLETTTTKLTTDFSHLNNKIFQIDVKSIVTIDMPETKINDTPHPAHSVPIITGIVTDNTPAGLPIITIQPSIETKNSLLLPDSQIVLQTNSLVVKGTAIQFTAEKITPEQYIQQLENPTVTTNVTESSLPITLRPITNLTWPALQEALQISNEIAIPITITALSNTIPSPSSPTKLIPTVMFFLAALRMGGIENWLGEKHLETMRQAGRKDIISRLSGDFSNLSRQSQETPSGEWRNTPIPLLHNEKIEIMQLFTKQQNNNEQNDNKENSQKSTRFILNLKLSEIGSIQLDGFLRHKKTLDIFLRTDSPLEPNIKQNLLKAFNTGIKQANLDGGQIIFQSEPKELVHIETNATTTEITI